MKFARYLKSHAIEEWSRAYINYRGLKKQIGRAEEELIALDEAEDEGNGGGEIAVGRGENEQGGAGRRTGEDRPPRPRAADRDLERGKNTHEDDEEEADDEATQAASVRASRRTSSRPSTPSSPQQLHHSPLTSPALSQVSSPAREVNSDDTGTTSRPLVRAASPSSSSSGRSHAHAEIKPQPSRPNPVRSLSRNVSQRDVLPRGPNRRWRPGLSPAMTVEEIMEKIPAQCRKFFTMLDRELEGVSGFYADREAEAAKRYEALSAQWRELAMHKKEFQAHRGIDCNTPRFVSSILPKHAHLPNVPGSHLVRRTIANRRNGTPARKSMDGSVGAGHEGYATGEEQADEAEERRRAYLHQRPDEYMAARSKLKLATFEFYRSLGMLKSYRVLNRTGFAKALKKFEKATAIPCAAQYTQKVDAANFVKSETLDELIRKTEDAFAEVFERGDRKKALERLRDFGQKKRHHFTSWRAGMLMGAGLPLMIEGLVLSFKASTRREIPYWPALLQLFGACFLPVFFTLAFFLNLAAWSYARINYVLIFELDVRNRLDYHQFIEIPALLYFILSLFWWAAWNNFWPDQISPSAYPLAWIVVVLIIMLNPLPIFYASARWWMLRSFTRMLTSGLVAVEFRDFFLGDEMNSLYYSVYNLGYLYCTYNKGWPSNVQSVCSTNKTWTTAVLSALPAFWRLGQSIRRYLDSDGLYLHLLNAGKYTASIAYFFAYYSWRIHEQNGDDKAWRLALFIVFASINSCWTSAWDLLMDWSLGSHGKDVPKKHFLLRKELAFFKDAPWMYYLASVLNVLLRFSWVFYLAPKPAVPVQGYIIALVEAGRRIMWNTLRVEAEHVGNRDGYRVTRDVALPYVTASSPEASGNLVEDTSDEPLSPSHKIFAWLHALHASIVKNLQPITDAFSEVPWLALGRRVDETERERREVEAQDAEARQEEGEEAEREARRRKEYERKKRKGRARRGKAGPDESSSEETTPEEAEGSGEEGLSTHEHDFARHRPRPDSGGSSLASAASLPSRPASPSTAAAQASLASAASLPSRPASPSTAAAQAAHHSVRDANQMRDEERVRGDEDEREDDQRLEEGMREVEQMGKGLER